MTKESVDLSVKIILVLGVAALCAGCTTTTSTPTASNRPDFHTTSEKRVYTQRDLEKTGQRDLGPAIESLDPSVESSHP